MNDIDPFRFNFLGKFALSLDLGSGPLYLTAMSYADPKTPDKPFYFGIGLRGGSTKDASFSLYEIFGSNPRLIALQSNAAAEGTMEPGFNFVVFGAGQPDSTGTYYPSGNLGRADYSTLGSDLAASSTTTQLLLTDIGAHLVARVWSGSPQFFAQRDGPFDSGRWGVSKLLDANGSWDNADLRRLYMTGWPLQSRSAQGTLLHGALFSRSQFTDCNFSGARLESAHLEDATWTGGSLANAQLPNAQLQNAQFRGCAMAGANLANCACTMRTAFSGCDLGGADFTGVDLTGVDFSGAKLANAKFGGAKLRGANLIGANLTGAQLAGVDLVGARFSSASLLAGANLQGAKLDSVDLTGVDLGAANLTGASLAGTILADAKMLGTVFDGTDLSSASFTVPARFTREANKPRTSLRNAKLPFKTIGLDWTYLDLSGATFVDMPDDLSNLQATGAVCQDAKLTDKKLAKACLDNADFTGAHLEGANLTDASLKGTWLGQAILTNARLVRADLTGAQLGAKKSLFTLARSRIALLDGLDGQVVSGPVRSDFDAAKVPLPAGAKVQARIKGRDWLILEPTGPGATKPLYSLLAGTNTDVTASSYQQGLAADLSDAYMPEAILTDANLCECLLDSVQWYSNARQAKGDNADFERASFIDANLGGIELAQARLFGAKFNRATLVNANFAGAHIAPSADGQRASFERASLQGVSFAQARVDGADFTNAAVSLEQGVPLFALEAALAPEIVTGPPSDKLKDAFAHHGPAILAGSRIEKTPAQWILHNGGDAPPDSGVSAYLKFNIVERNTGGFQVYGSGLWITGVDEDEHTFSTQATFGATSLGENEMKAAANFPNGKSYDVYAKEQATWEQMMTAHEPPSPPPCIPDSQHWCIPAPTARTSRAPKELRATSLLTQA